MSLPASHLLGVPTASTSDAATPNGLLSVVLLHKPRGSTGVWQPVEVDQRLRVSSKSGKAVRLQITSKYEVDWQTLNIQMIASADKERSGWMKQPMAEGYVITSSNYKDQNGIWTATLDLKIKELYKRIWFHAEVHSTTGQLISGQSMSVITHNTGRDQPKAKQHSSPGNDQDIDSPNEQLHAAVQFQGQLQMQAPIPASNRMDGRATVRPVHANAHADECFDLGPPLAATATNTAMNRAFLGQEQPAGFLGPVGAPLVRTQPNVEFGLPMQQQQSPIQNHPIVLAGFGRGEVNSPHLPPSLPPQLQAPPANGPAIGPDGGLYISQNLHVLGQVAARAFHTFSDARLKTDVDDIVDAIELLKHMSGKSYRWDPKVMPTGAGGTRVLGVIAQEMKNVLPEAVHESEDGWLSVDYVQIIPVLIEGFKLQMANLNTMKSTVIEYNLEMSDKLDDLAHKCRALHKKLTKARLGSKESSNSLMDSKDTASTATTLDNVESEAGMEEMTTLHHHHLALPAPASSSEHKDSSMQRLQRLRFVEWIRQHLCLCVAALILLNVAALALALGFGIGARPKSAEPPAPTQWVPQSINGNFETYDPSGKASSWDGNYDIGYVGDLTSGRPTKREIVDSSSMNLQELLPAPFDIGTAVLLQKSGAPGFLTSPEAVVTHAVSIDANQFRFIKQLNLSAWYYGGFTEPVEVFGETSSHSVILEITFTEPDGRSILVTNGFAFSPNFGYYDNKHHWQGNWKVYSVTAAEASPHCQVTGILIKLVSKNMLGPAVWDNVALLTSNDAAPPGAPAQGFFPSPSSPSYRTPISSESPPVESPPLDPTVSPPSEDPVATTPDVPPSLAADSPVAWPDSTQEPSSSPALTANSLSSQQLDLSPVSSPVPLDLEPGGTISDPPTDLSTESVPGAAQDSAIPTPVDSKVPASVE